MASRALASVKSKLQGIVDEHALSVGGQVAYLVQEARSEVNLSVIYPGWSPHL
jgi:phosphatidylinositol kinase/protein kinase (PI-3  family)